jgi:hypothetical protein
MEKDRNGSSDFDRFQFSMRTLLLVVTATCLLLGFLEWMVPKSLPIGIRLTMYIMIATVVAYGSWTVYQAKRRSWMTPANYLTVKVDAKWKRRVKSPLIVGPIATLTGVSLTFAPAYLLWCGQVEKFGILEWILVPLCFVIIYTVPGFYMSLASEVIAELRKPEAPPGNS